LNVLDGKSLLITGSHEVQQRDGYLTVSDSEVLRIPAPITVAAWFKARSYDRAMTVAGRAYNGPAWRYPFLSWLIRINTNTIVEGDVGDGRSYSPAGWDVPSLLPGQWYHVAMTYDGNSKALFLNGVPQTALASGSQSYSSPISYTSGKPVIIGADESDDPVGDVFDGSIDDVKIFKQALQPPEIQALVKDTAGKYGVNP
jgi:hypothetical protein